MSRVQLLNLHGQFLGEMIRIEDFHAGVIKLPPDLDFKNGPDLRLIGPGQPYADWRATLDYADWDRRVGERLAP